MFATRLRWLAAGAILGVLTSTALFLALWRFTGLGDSSRQTLSPPSIAKEIQQLNTLVSVKYVIQKAIGIEEKKVPFGTEKIFLFMQADVLAGVELDQLTGASIAADSGRIAISLPPPRILHVVVDDKETRVWDRGITWWTPWVPANPDLERQARLRAKEAIEKAALEMGILGKAKENAQTSIRGLLMGLGAKSVVFILGT